MPNTVHGVLKSFMHAFPTLVCTLHLSLMKTTITEDGWAFGDSAVK